MVLENPVCSRGTLNARKDLSTNLGSSMKTMVNGENSLIEYELNIVRVVSYLEMGEKVVFCRASVSRSNAIALGVLVHYFKIDFSQALQLITSKIPICDILPPLISALCKLLNVQSKIEV
jgi:hypothetical protein